MPFNSTCQKNTGSTQDGASIFTSFSPMNSLCLSSTQLQIPKGRVQYGESLKPQEKEHGGNILTQRNNAEIPHFSLLFLHFLVSHLPTNPRGQAAYNGNSQEPKFQMRIIFLSLKQGCSSNKMCPTCKEGPKELTSTGKITKTRGAWGSNLIRLFMNLGFKLMPQMHGSDINQQTLRH